MNLKVTPRSTGQQIRLWIPSKPATGRPGLGVRGAKLDAHPAAFGDGFDDLDDAVPRVDLCAEAQPSDIAVASPGDTPAPTRLKVLTPPYDESDQTPKAPGAAQVSAGAMAGNILTKVTPVYPQAAKDAKIQGAVVLDAVIGKDGLIKSLKLVSGPEELTHSAWNAVSQWTYKPYLLNGEPTEVETTITVNYSLAP
jgi:TonB family protein